MCYLFRCGCSEELHTWGLRLFASAQGRVSMMQLHCCAAADVSVRCLERPQFPLSNNAEHVRFALMLHGVGDVTDRISLGLPMWVFWNNAGCVYVALTRSRRVAYGISLGLMLWDFSNIAEHVCCLDGA
jgi:hypothetical protein